MFGLKNPHNEAIVLYGWKNFAETYKMTILPVTILNYQHVSMVGIWHTR